MEHTRLSKRHNRKWLGCFHWETGQFRAMLGSLSPILSRSGEAREGSQSRKARSVNAYILRIELVLWTGQCYLSSSMSEHQSVPGSVLVTSRED